METFLCLSNENKNIYNSILCALKSGRDEFTVPNTTDMSVVTELVKIVLAENSEFFYYDSCLINCRRFVFESTVILKKWVQPHLINQYNSNFQAQSQRIIQACIKPNMNAMRKVLALYSYLSDNVKYYYGNGMYQEHHTAYGAIVNGCAVCEGISAAFSHLLSLVGIRSTVVNGSTHLTGAVRHTWNIVEINGKYYHFDLTWDLYREGNPAFSRLDYFALTDSDMSNRIWKREIYPPCQSSDINFFNLSHSLANSDAELTAIAKRQFAKNSGLYIRCPYLLYLENDEEYSNYVLNVLQSDYDVACMMQGTLAIRVNTNLSIICVMKE